MISRLSQAGRGRAKRGRSSGRVLMITSAAHERWPLDVPISDLPLGGQHSRQREQRGTFFELLPWSEHAANLIIRDSRRMRFPPA